MKDTLLVVSKKKKKYEVRRMLYVPPDPWTDAKMASPDLLIEVIAKDLTTVKEAIKVAEELGAESRERYALKGTYILPGMRKKRLTTKTHISEYNYDRGTFGSGPEGGCQHKNAQCAFNIGPDCECPDCGATW